MALLTLCRSVSERTHSKVLEIFFSITYECDMKVIHRKDVPTSMILLISSANSNLEIRISFRSSRPAAAAPSFICEQACVCDTRICQQYGALSSNCLRDAELLCP